jgi:hypothetical protein
VKGGRYEQAIFTKRCVIEPEVVKQELLTGIRHYVGPDYDDDVHLQSHQIRCEIGQPVESALRRSILDDDCSCPRSTRARVALAGTPR